MIEGARQTILRHKPVLYVGNDSSEKSAALIQLLWDLDYDCSWHEAARVRVPNFRGDAENSFPDLVSVSLLCVPRSRQVKVTGFRKVDSVQDRPQWQGTLPLSRPHRWPERSRTDLAQPEALRGGPPLL